MKTLITKSALGVLGVGGLSLGSYYGYQAFNKETEKQKINIQNKLEQEKYTLLNSQSTYFDAILRNYKASNSKFEDFNGDGANNETAKDILLRHCNEIFKKESIDNENYSKAKKWCVEPITVKALLEKRNINALNTDTEPNTEKAKWEGKIKEYRSREDFRITGLTINSRRETPPTPEEIESIKRQCNSIKDRPNHDDKFEETLKAFELWCSNI